MNSSDLQDESSQGYGHEEMSEGDLSFGGENPGGVESQRLQHTDSENEEDEEEEERDDEEEQLEDIDEEEDNEEEEGNEGGRQASEQDEGHDQEDDKDDDEEDDNEDEDEEEEEEDDEVVEMKAKFDRIMSNFVEDHGKREPDDRAQHMTGSFGGNNAIGVEQLVGQGEQKGEEIQAIVHGPDNENYEQSVNIEITSKPIFPQGQSKAVSKPPPYSKPKANKENMDHNAAQKPPHAPILRQQKKQAHTPDREKPLREQLQQQQPPVPLKRGKSSGKLKSTKPMRPQTAKPKISKLSEEEEDNDIQETVVKKKVVFASRPQTAKPSAAATFYSGGGGGGQKKPVAKGKARKSDPVSRYQSMQNEWKRNEFLKASQSKQGRKLELDRFHKWKSIMQIKNAQVQPQELKVDLFRKKTQIQKLVQQTKQVQHCMDDRKDDLRFNLRAKMSQLNYVDKEMRAFHYNQEMHEEAGKGKAEAEKLQQIKKQICHLKKCI